jgi:hypothetical protein
MCKVCVEWQAGRLTSKEALRNLGELLDSDSDLMVKHYYGVIEDIMDKEVPFVEEDKELEKIWHDETHD